MSDLHRAAAAPTRPAINNAFYDELGERWYEDDTHAVALLRAESRCKLQYVRDVLTRRGIHPPARILDGGCGAGFLSLPLAGLGYRVKGIDLSPGSLAVARRRADPGLPLELARGDALALEEPAASYDAVLLLDVLEHVARPEQAIAEAARVLRPGGVLIFHTFNRTPAAWLLAVKALELATRDCPSHVHVYEMFLKPGEVAAMARREGLSVAEMYGLRPKFGSSEFWWSLVRRRIHPEFPFVLSRSLAVGYVGFATLDDARGH